MGQAKLAQEQMTNGGQCPMSLDREVPANLKMVHPQLGLGVLEHPLDAPAAERHLEADDRLCSLTTPPYAAIVYDEVDNGSSWQSKTNCSADHPVSGQYRPILPRPMA